jgi:hypothetical protein
VDIGERYLFGAPFVGALFLLLFAAASCQTVNESCQHDCYATGEQTRGGNSPATQATVPLIP